MPRIIHSRAEVTIAVDVVNDDGSKFKVSRTFPAEFATSVWTERGKLLGQVVNQAAERFNHSPYLEASAENPIKIPAV
jgi:hypothetical protein